jgi:predicted metal-dependent hydrolase
MPLFLLPRFKIHESGVEGSLPMNEEIVWQASKGRTLRLRVRADGALVVSLPGRMSRREAESFLQKQKTWIERARARMSVRERLPKVSGPLRKQERLLAAERIRERLAYFNKDRRFPVRRVVIRDQRTRWGSCSSRGTLSFQYRLIRLPIPLLDYVVVHELCHLHHHHHGPTFWAAVAELLPDYERLRQLLKQYALE